MNGVGVSKCVCVHLADEWEWMSRGQCGAEIWNNVLESVNKCTSICIWCTCICVFVHVVCLCR